MVAYDLLSDPIKKYIRDKKWEAFRPIQQAAILKILSTDHNYILAARTASGKTEAAFLPIISQVDFNEAGIQVLYISPLIALINDQFNRVNQLCRYLDVQVTKWHGEASQAKKKHLRKNPSGILLITPESIEAMFVNRPFEVSSFFSNLQFIVIDEIHGFLGTPRGTQLKSLLYRISLVSSEKLRFVGLSATLGSYYESAKQFFGEKRKTVILRDSSPQPIEVSIEFYPSQGSKLPIDLLKRLYLETQQKKTLVFPNSRGRVEEIAVNLKKIAARNNGHTYYYAHHSSVNKELREFIEQFVKTNERYNYAIACTSTLELGIDIGSVDLVVQIDSTFSVSSLAQRLGRSGRIEGTKSNLLLCATHKWTLLQSIACFELLKEGFVEPLKDIEYPIDILFHQILSIVQENSGLDQNILFAQITQNHTFKNMAKEDIIYLLKFMIKKEYLENLNGELIIGYTSEPLLSRRSFYAVFETPTHFQVLLKNRAIGEIPPSVQLSPGENIFLAALIWKILEVDVKARKIYVRKANDGKAPLFFGSGGLIHPRIREKMLELVVYKQVLKHCSEEVKEQLDEFQLLFKEHQITDTKQERPVFFSEEKLVFYSFAGSRINKTIFFLLKHQLGIDCTLDETQSSFTFYNITYLVFNERLNDVIQLLPALESYLITYLPDKEEAFPFSKWGKLLPIKLKAKILVSSYFELKGTFDFLTTLRCKVVDTKL